jgi:hypothetical protein
MLKPKTHFEQIPLAVVKRIVGVPVSQGIKPKRDRVSRKKKPETIGRKFPLEFSSGGN